MFKNYKTGELFSYLGVTRDTLRFYEKKGLINPNKDNDNNYRNYDIYDVYRIMIIDFYKKRGLSIQQIKSVLKDTESANIDGIFSDKITELQKSILEQQSMLNRIMETRDFRLNLERYLNEFTLKTMPVYRINDEVSDFIAVEEYESVLEFSSMDDMLSKIMRHISFDNNGVIESSMYIVEPALDNCNKEVVIGNRECLYTIIEEKTVDKQKEINSDVMADMFARTQRYANQHDVNLTGEAYAIIRYITCDEGNINAYIEIFIPIK